MQLVDELSMIYTTCLMFWATFEHNRPQPVPTLLAVFVFGLAMFVTLYYHYLQDPTFHQNAYAILTALVLLRSMYVMERSLRPYFRQRRQQNGKMMANGKVTSAADEREEVRKDERDRDILQRMWIMIAVGLSVFIGGFVIWTMDSVHCSQLRAWRREVGLPWGVLLEGHGWWHLMTGTGAYFYIGKFSTLRFELAFENVADFCNQYGGSG